jgi:hypothetical protein
VLSGFRDSGGEEFSEGGAMKKIFCGVLFSTLISSCSYPIAHMDLVILNEKATSDLGFVAMDEWKDFKKSACEDIDYEKKSLPMDRVLGAVFLADSHIQALKSVHMDGNGGAYFPSSSCYDLSAVVGKF